MKTEVKYLGNTKGELFTSWHYVWGRVVRLEYPWFVMENVLPSMLRISKF